MKIELDSYNCCTTDKCFFRRECAQHKSAGDFRSESGFAPEINFNSSQSSWECLTADEKPKICGAETLPENVDKLGSGFLKPCKVVITLSEPYEFKFDPKIHPERERRTALLGWHAVAEATYGEQVKRSEVFLGLPRQSTEDIAIELARSAINFTNE